jgi:PKHD-type hydroxylase
VKLAAGDAIVYPGTSLHRVNPVTRGTRYASFFWTHSLVKSAEQRRLLFDLDQSIQQLTQEQPEHPRVAALSGTYHNLLRMWSESCPRGDGSPCRGSPCWGSPCWLSPLAPCLLCCLAPI